MKLFGRREQDRKQVSFCDECASVCDGRQALNERREADAIRFLAAGGRRWA